MSILTKTDNKNESHLVLLNRKTGKIASSNSWLLALAARAHTIGDTSGIAGLLPQEQAKKLLVSNALSTKVARRAKAGWLTDKISDQAVTWCCQTNDCKHQIDGAIEIYALNN